MRERRTFRGRTDAGRSLASLLNDYAGRPDVIVLGLPRGGVPVAAEVAAGLGAPLDVFLVRKLGVPGHAELARGAIRPTSPARSSSWWTTGWRRARPCGPPWPPCGHSSPAASWRRCRSALP